VFYIRSAVGCVFKSFISFHLLNAKWVVVNTKCIVVDTKWIVVNTKWIVVNAKWIVDVLQYLAKKHAIYIFS